MCDYVEASCRGTKSGHLFMMGGSLMSSTGHSAVSHPADKHSDTKDLLEILFNKLTFAPEQTSVSIQSRENTNVKLYIFSWVIQKLVYFPKLLCTLLGHFGVFTSFILFFTRHKREPFKKFPGYSWKLLGLSWSRLYME